MLEAQQGQLVSGLQELYKRVSNGQGWTGSPLKESSNGVPLTHDILERLGVLKHEGQNLPADFEENLEELQKRLLANGAGFMQRELSFDGSSDIDRQPFDQPHQKTPSFANPFQGNHFPPTPPTQSPHTTSARTSSPLKTQFPVDVQMQQYSTWTPEFDDMDFMATYEPMTDITLNAMQLQAQMLQAQGSINPCLTIKDWDPQFFNPNMVV
jgi:hypothetical protein